MIVTNDDIFVDDFVRMELNRLDSDSESNEGHSAMCRELSETVLLLFLHLKSI